MPVISLLQTTTKTHYYHIFFSYFLF